VASSARGSLHTLARTKERDLAVQRRREDGVWGDLDRDVEISRPAHPRRLQDMSMRPFERVVTEDGPTVLRVCRAVLGPVDADDAWSETFLAALRAYPDLPEVEACAQARPWL
jgi:hypothetical protein